MPSSRQSKTAAMIAAAIFSTLTLQSAVHAADAGTADPRDRMDVWAGRWNEVVDTQETPFGHAKSTKAHTTCAWTPDRGYMVCEYLSEVADPAQASASNHLSIFAYNDRGGVYKHLGISKDYKTLEETPVKIEGGVWSYDYSLPGKDGSTIALRDSYEFVTSGQRITRIEASTDGGKSWMLVSRSVATRAS
jgi:hypothetical protein